MLDSKRTGVSSAALVFYQVPAVFITAVRLTDSAAVRFTRALHGINMAFPQDQLVLKWGKGRLLLLIQLSVPMLHQC
jgi:hypothetical protein